MIRAVWPIIRNCLSISGQRLVEYAWRCSWTVLDADKVRGRGRGEIRSL